MQNVANRGTRHNGQAACPKIKRKVAHTQNHPVNAMEIMLHHISQQHRTEQHRTHSIENAAKRAIQASGKFIPIEVVTISADGKILKREVNI